MSRAVKIKSPAPDTMRPAADAFRELENRLAWNDKPGARPASAGGLAMSSEKTLGFELRNALHRIFSARTRDDHAVGNLDGWARTICYAAAKIDGQISPAIVRKHAGWIGVDIPADILAPVVREAGAALSAGVLEATPAIIGEAIQLTAAEREDLEIRRLIDACDETAKDRRRRMNRERQAKRRASLGAKARSQSLNAREPWKELGICRATYYRQKGETKTSRTPISKILNKGKRDETVSFPGKRDEIVSARRATE